MGSVATCAMLPGRPTWEMTKKYIAIGKWRTYLQCFDGHSRNIWEQMKWIKVEGFILHLVNFQEFAECDGLLFSSIVPLFVPWLTFVAQHVEADLPLNFAQQKPAEAL